MNIIVGYSHVYDARQRRIGGGVIIYIDLRMPYRIRSDLKLITQFLNPYSSK